MNEPRELEEIEVYAAPAPPTVTLGLALDEAAVTINMVVPAGATRVWLSRTAGGGDPVFVRGVVDLQVTPLDTLLLFDFEAPFGVPLTYSAVAGNAGGEISPTPNTATITLTSNSTDDPWIIDVGAPGNSQRIKIESLAELTYAIPVGVHKVIGRRGPIVLSDIAPYPSFELNFVTGSQSERENARGSLGNGVPLLLKTPPEQGVGNLYLSVLSWVEGRPSRIALHADRHFKVSGQQVDRPDPKLVVPIALIQSYLEVRQGFADYADVKASRSSYEALKITFAGGAGGAVIPWPPTDA